MRQDKTTYDVAYLIYVFGPSVSYFISYLIKKIYLSEFIKTYIIISRHVSERTWETILKILGCGKSNVLSFEAV